MAKDESLPNKIVSEIKETRLIKVDGCDNNIKDSNTLYILAPAPEIVVEPDAEGIKTKNDAKLIMV